MDEDPQVLATRNVPPKRVRVSKGSVTYGGIAYREGDVFLLGEGSTADALALEGIVEIVSHEEVEAWNGAEGDAIRARALARIDEDTVGERTHNHGFDRFPA